MNNNAKEIPHRACNLKVQRELFKITSEIVDGLSYSFRS